MRYIKKIITLNIDYILRETLYIVECDYIEYFGIWRKFFKIG